MKKATILIISILLVNLAFTQSITNISPKLEGQKIAVTYNLQSDGAANISLFISEDGGKTFTGPLKQVSGDIGLMQPGTNKKIIWDVLKERKILHGNNIVFRVKAEPIKGLITETTAGLNLDMILVQGDTFTMGCTSEQGSDCYDSEKPSFNVTLSDYYIGKYPVTQAQWKAVMGNNPSHFSGCDNCPVEYVSWNDIQEFLKKINQMTGKNYRLPTEAEWEFAARGGVSATATKYAGSNNIDEVAWYTSNSGSKTKPVGTKKPNELGIYDMSGNVWEWCGDWYGDYSSSSKTNPTGASTGSYRVLRGGSWINIARRCRVSDRGSGSPVSRYRNDGFRVVLSP
jgi:formylglycine-generating enzyme required for sulfatase activity